MSTLDAVMTSSLAQNNDVDSNHLLMRPCFDKGIFSLNENACNKNDIVESLLDETGTAGITSDFREKKSMEHEEVEPEFSDLDTGWAWVVLVASFFSFALFGGSMYSAGIIHNALLERFQASVGLTAWVGALHTGILLLGGLLSTAVADRFSCRTAIIFSGLFYTGGYLATAFVTCIEAAIFTCGIVVGFFICCAGMQVNLITFGMLCFPSELEKYSHKMRLRDSDRLLEGTNGFSENQAAFLISLSGILTVFGRLLTGVVANIRNRNEIILYAGSMGILSIATIVYPFISRHYAGSCYVVLTTVSLMFIGINYIATAIGLVFMFGGVGAIVGPVIAGILVDSGGTYDQSMTIAGVCILLAAVCGAISICFVAKGTSLKEKL
ncbi:MOT14-like protein [Mya arenaria]|uniref:MOT14-like protein n=1 Tax=Mya arenaria TaxID=6604 RepID=A0ABY7FIW1_MYAAR|nr:MOT14-like protein [Mya arenaria]